MEKKPFDIKLIIIALVLTIIAVFTPIVILTVLNNKTNEGKTIKTNFSISDSGIISDTPEETAVKYIYRNGTMGDTQKEISKDTLLNNDALHNNAERRISAYEDVAKATVPGSSLISTSYRSRIEKYALGLRFPIFYEIKQDSIKVAKKDNERRIDILSENGLSNYKAVDVYISFVSDYITYSRSNDTSYDGTYKKNVNEKKVADLMVTLIEIDGKWLVYDIPNAETELNSRFATWKNTTLELIDTEKTREVESIKVEEIKNWWLENF